MKRSAGYINLKQIVTEPVHLAITKKLTLNIRAKLTYTTQSLNNAMFWHHMNGLHYK